MSASCAVLSPAAQAADSVWNAHPTDGDWNTAANWTPQTVPNGPDATATFGVSSVKGISFSAQTTVSGISFTAGASPFVFTSKQLFLALTGTGITNDSGTTQQFMTLGTSSGIGGFFFEGAASAGNDTSFSNSPDCYIGFSGTTTAASASFTNLGAKTAGDVGGIVQFADSASAGTATIVSDGGLAAEAFGGEVTFQGNSTAGGATLTSNAGAVAGTYNTTGASTSFSGNATAGDATIISNGGSVAGLTGGLIYFGGNSDAGNAILIAHAGSHSGGTIRFDSPATGGKARVEVFGNGTLDLTTASPTMTFGSIEGSGKILESVDGLIVAGNDLSTTFSGVMEGNFSGLTKVGSGTLTLSGENSYTGPTLVSGGKLDVEGTVTSDVTVGTGATLGGGGNMNNLTVNSGGEVAPGDPKTLHVNGNYQQADGATLSLAIAGLAAADNDQLAVTGSVTFATGAVLELNFSNGYAPRAGNVFTLVTAASINGSTIVKINGLAPGFQYSVIADTNGNLLLTAKNNGVATSTATKLLNISTRVDVGTGQDVLIGGFIVTGTAPKKVLLRAIGPSLSAYGLTGLLADPVIELHEANGTVVSNDNWKDTQEQAIIATGLAPKNDLESAIVATLAPGAYTAIVSGKNGGIGLALVEAYDLSTTALSEFANISTRGDVGTGQNVMIGGFILGGGGETSAVIVRGLGPSLRNAGISDTLQDPALQLVNSNGTVIANNDDWMTDPNEQSVVAAGLAPMNPKESAIAITLSPDSYTVIEQGEDAGTGVGLVEIYRLP